MADERMPGAEIGRLMRKVKGESVPKSTEYWVQIFKYEPRTGQCTPGDKAFLKGVLLSLML